MQRLPHILHSVAISPWGVWVASAAVLVGLGAFLDEYYVGNAARARVREQISRTLQRIEGSGKRVRELTGLFWGASAGLCLGIGFFAAVSSERRLLRLPGELSQKHAVLGVLAIPLVLMEVVQALLESAVSLVVMAASVWVFVELSFNACKFVLWLVFKPAAEPQRSPFKFLTSMLGLWVLVGKLLVELAKKHS